MPNDNEICELHPSAKKPPFPHALGVANFEEVFSKPQKTTVNRFPKHVVAALQEAGFPLIGDDQAVVITSMAGLVGWVSPGFTSLSGYSLEEMKGRKPGSVLQGPGSHISDIRALGAAVRNRKPMVRNVLNYHKDGHPYFCEVDVRPFSSGFIAVERLIGSTLGLENGH